MKNLRLGMVVAALVSVCALSAAMAEDEKPTRERWFLTLEHGPLRTVVVNDAGGRSQAHHYMTMKVTNGTRFPRQWHPLVKAITDTKQTLIAGGFTEALQEIRRVEHRPGLVPIGTTAGRLEAGASVDTVAIFGPVDPLYDTINLQVFGLVDPVAIYKVEQYGAKSPPNAKEGEVVLGEDSVIVDSAYWTHNQAIIKRLKDAAAEAGGEVPQPHVEYQEVAESRYWSMVYERLGDEFNAEDDIIKFKHEGWRVQGDPTGLRVISTEGMP
jgi:hypothetical protein